MEETKNQWDTIQEEEEDNTKWVTHYSSDHQILLVGEGDFSFSLSLAKSFGSAANIVASSLNSYGHCGKLMNENKGYLLESHCSRVQNPNDLSHVDNVTKMYKHAKSNLDDLHKLGACLLHGVDATKMKLHSDLKMRRFDRVIFNFPHAGFHGREDNTSLIKMHKALVLGFFNNASRMLRANGEIHISHKTTAPFSHWNIKNLAAQCFLTLIECADFNREDYPGYNNKRGDGYRCDEPFPLGKCCTYKFAYIPKAKRKRMKRKQMMAFRQQINLPVQEIEYAVEQLPTSAHLNYYPIESHYLKMEEETSILALKDRHTSITGGHSSSMAEVHGRGAPSGGYSSLGMSLVPPRTLQPMEPVQSLQPWPTSVKFRYSLTDHIRTRETVPELLYTPRTLQPMEPLQSLRPWPTSANVRYSLKDHIRTMETVPKPLYTPRTLQPMEPLQSLRPWRTSANVRYSLKDHIRAMETVPEPFYTRRKLQPRPTSTDNRYSLTDHLRTMETVGVSLDARNEGYRVNGGRSNYFQEEHGGSHGARNEGYYQVYGGCSNDWQQEHCRTTNQSASSLDAVSSDFDRFIAEVPGRSVQSELHRMNILMSERRVFVQS